MAHPSERDFVYTTRDRSMRKLTAILLIAAAAAWAGELKPAEELYQRTDYQGSLRFALNVRPPTADSYNLIGRDYFMMGEFKKAAEAFEHAVTLEPRNSSHVHWLGRTYGRRAETASPLLAPSNASKARQCFERAVELDPGNREALNDLFDYYLQAPGFLGGGFEKAAAIAQRIGDLDPAEYHFAQAQLADKRKQFDTAEQQLRRAMALAPRQVGRVLDLAKYLAKEGRYQESDATFQQAEKLAPNSPKVMFAKARTYVQEKRNLDQAKTLLKRYLESTLTPEDPPREEAEKLLRQAGA
jgi:tetratricopeptide (TPR) repeat protein